MRKKTSSSTLCWCMTICIILVSLVSCTIENPSVIQLKPNQFNYTLLSENLSQYEKTLSEYTPLPHEYSGDLYSTYYSLKIVDSMGQTTVPTTNINYLLNNTSNIMDVFLICELYKSSLGFNDLKPKIIEQLHQYYNEGLFNLYKNDNETSMEPINIVFALFYAVRCMEVIEMEEEYLNINTDWILDFQNEFVSNEPTNIISDMNIIYQLIIINDYYGLQTQQLWDYAKNYYYQFQKEVIADLKALNTEIFFNFEAYWFFIERLAYTDNLSTYDLDEIISTVKCIDGGFSLDNNILPNPQITYIILEISKRYNLNIEFSDFLITMNRHKLEDGTFISYSLQADTKSSYYANEINQLILPQKSSAYSPKELSFYSISAQKSQSTQEEIDFVESYITSKLNTGNNLTSMDLSNLAGIVDNTKYLSDNNVLKERVYTTINDLSKNLDEKTNTDYTVLYDALYVYVALWGEKDINRIIKANISNDCKYLSEIYSFTRLLFETYENNFLTNITEEQYNNMTQTILNSYDDTTGLFYYSIENKQTNMATLYYGTYLSKIYFEE